MAFFDNELGSSAEVFNKNDDDTNDTTTYSASADVTFTNLYIFRPSVNDINVLGEEIQDMEANPIGDYSSSITKQAKIIQNGKTYIVINDPSTSYYPLNNFTKLELKFVGNTEDA